MAGKRISLYFDPFAWERLNRYLSLLLLSGKPMYDLPSMNDLIEGMVVYVSNMLSGLSISGNDIMPFIEDGFSVPSGNYSVSIQYNKGRIAFNVTQRTETAIQDMRNASSKFNKLGKDEDFLQNVSDPILIRACVYYVLTQPYNDFDQNLFVSFLFGFRPMALPLRYKRNDMLYKIENETRNLSESEKNNLRKIIWDEGIIKGILGTLSANEDHFGHFYLSLDDAIKLEYQSRGFDFNYYSAFIGFAAFRRSRKSDMQVPVLLIHFGIDESDISEFDSLLEKVKEISADFISSRISNSTEPRQED